MSAPSDTSTDLFMAVPSSTSNNIDFPDDFWCLEAMQNCDVALRATWQGLSIEFILMAEATPAGLDMCPVHVRLPASLNKTLRDCQKIGRLWLISGRRGISGNTIGFPIPRTHQQTKVAYQDFIFTEIAVHEPVGRYSFLFQLMVKDPTAPGGWGMAAKKTSAEFGVGSCLSYGK